MRKSHRADAQMQMDADNLIFEIEANVTFYRISEPFFGRILVPVILIFDF